jgi:divinyl protochlorophyllide a 8-vinyl-reductase
MRAVPTDASRIGPNAVTRLVEALVACGHDPRPIFSQVDLERHLADPPTAMVAEADVTALYVALFTALGADEARRVGDDAGARTARYLLCHRIPKPARAVLRVCPPRLAQRLLLALIAKHAWTFAGSAALTIHHGNPARVVFAGSPFARGIVSDRPACAFYVGTFRGLCQTLVTPRATVVETACAAAGAPHCVLEIGH